MINNKAVYTTALDTCGWAGAVMWGAGAVRGAIYTRASVMCDWAGAVMGKLLAEYMCDGPTDGPTDRVTYRVACTRLKRALDGPGRWQNPI